MRWCDDSSGTTRGTRAIIVALAFVSALSLTGPAAAQGVAASPSSNALVCSDVDGVMPSHVIVREPFPHLLGEMLALSPTFRAQCARLAAATQLRVVMRLDLRSCRSDYAATTVFTYERNGDLLARIDFQLRPNYVATVAHEIEHVLEQLDRWQLRVLARTSGSGVCEVEPGTFETDRAVRAANAVEDEMFRGRRTTQRLPTHVPTAASFSSLPPHGVSAAPVRPVPGTPGS